MANCDDDHDERGPTDDPEGGCHCGDNCDRGPFEECPKDVVEVTINKSSPHPAIQ